MFHIHGCVYLHYRKYNIFIFLSWRFYALELYGFLLDEFDSWHSPSNLLVSLIEDEHSICPQTLER